MHTLTSTPTMIEAKLDILNALNASTNQTHDDGGRTINPDLNLAAAHKPSLGSMDVLFLSGYHAIEAVSSMLGDIGGAISHSDIPDTHELATVGFVTYEFFDGVTPNINNVMRLMCIPKDATLDDKARNLFNGITFDCIDDTSIHETFNDDHIKNLIDDAKEQDETLVLGYTAWQITIRPQKHKEA